MLIVSVYIPCYILNCKRTVKTLISKMSSNNVTTTVSSGDLSGIRPPYMDWSASDLPTAFREFKQYCELIFKGPLADGEGSVGQSAGTVCDVKGSVSAVLSACKRCLDQMHTTWAGVTGARLYYKSSAFNEETLMSAFFRTFERTWGEETSSRVSFTPVTVLQYYDRVLALSC